MQTATVDVTFVKQPAEGKQYGSIKGTNNEWWPVKNDRIREFEPGNKYELAYTESDKGFKNIIGVKKIVAQPEPRGDFAEFREPQRNGATLTTAPAQTKPQAPANGYYRPTAPKDSERMWTCAILGHYIDRGEVPLHKESVKAAINLLREAYQEAIVRDLTEGENPSSRDSRDRPIQSGDNKKAPGWGRALRVWAIALLFANGFSLVPGMVGNAIAARERLGPVAGGILGQQQSMLPPLSSYKAENILVFDPAATNHCFVDRKIKPRFFYIGRSDRMGNDILSVGVQSKFVFSSPIIFGGRDCKINFLNYTSRLASVMHSDEPFPSAAFDRPIFCESGPQIGPLQILQRSFITAQSEPSDNKQGISEKNQSQVGKFHISGTNDRFKQVVIIDLGGVAVAFIGVLIFAFISEGVGFCVMGIGCLISFYCANALL